MNVDGSNTFRVTNDGNQKMNPVFSPDDSEIMYTQILNNNSIGLQLYQINADGNNKQQIQPQCSNCVPYNAVYSPDGSKILFINPNTTDLYIFSNIYTMNIDGSNVVAITNDSTYKHYAQYSPDGSKIVFMSDSVSINETAIEQINIANVDGSNAIQITNFRLHPDSYMNSTVVSSPNWSPDGSKIIFSSNVDISGGLNELYIINTDGSGMMRLTHFNKETYHPKWI